MLMSNTGQDRFVFLEGKEFYFAGSMYGFGILIFSAILLPPFLSPALILAPPFCYGALIASALMGVATLKIAQRIVERVEQSKEDE